MNLHLIVPPGTQIVSNIEIKAERDEILCLPGGLGTIINAPTDNSHSYLIRLINDREVTLHRHQFSIRKHYQRGSDYARGLLAKQNLYEYVIYRCVVGSRAYGLEHENSDTDWRGIYLPPAELHWSLYGIPEQLENDERQECYWELQKFILLALKANPNILECLYTPKIEKATDIVRELLDKREIFLSQLAYQTYGGYVMSQFKKMEQDMRTRGKVRLKHAMHLIRLLLSGITILKHGFVPVKVENYRDELIAIRDGSMPWSEINEWRLDLHRKFDSAKASSSLPERPDYERADALLVEARKIMYLTQK